MRIPFIGQGSVGRSEFVNSERLVNLFPRIDQTSRATLSLYGCPGLLRKRILSGDGPVRAMLTDENLLYVVSGDKLFSLATGFIATLRGTIDTDTGFLSMATNGLVVLIVDGSKGWTYTISGGAFAQITDADFPATPVMCAVLDNTFIVVEGGTQRFWTSTDGTTWESADFASAETAPDDLVGCVVDHQELILFGKETTEIWYNSGGTFTFSRRTSLENGCISAASIAKMDNRVFWLDHKGVVRAMTGYNDQRVSTHAEEYRIWQHTFTEISAASAFTYSQEGHAFYQLTVGDETFVYDVAANRWHDRSYMDPTTGILGRHRASCAAQWKARVVVGDYENSKLYEYDLDTYTDDGDYIQATATFKPLINEGKEVFYHRFEVEMEPGVGLQTGQGSDPQIEMALSNDGGKTWEPWDQRDMGAVGDYSATASWDGLGASRNRVFEIRITDPVKRVISNAYIDVSAGLS